MATRRESDPRKDAVSRPLITGIVPQAAIPGGELQIHGRGLTREHRPRVSIGDVDAQIVIGSDSYVVARVPDGASAGEVVVVPNGDLSSDVFSCEIGVQVAEAGPGAEEAGRPGASPPSSVA